MLTTGVLSTLFIFLSSSTLTSASGNLAEDILIARKVHVSRARGFHRGVNALPRNLRRDSNPVNLSPGSLTTAEGCTTFYAVASGDTCYAVAEQYGISLDTFYAMNPEIDADCFNLNAGFSYCVAQTASTSPASVAVVKSTPAADVYVAPTTTTTTKAAASTKEGVKVAVVAAAVAPKKETTTTTTTTTTVAAVATPASVSSDLSLISLAGITQFLGINGATNNAIMSWFHTDSSTDSTNGRSWCEFNYNDSIPGFAPDVSLMINNFGGDQDAARAAYCGLEAKFTLANGKTALLYVADGFDSKWVRTPGSVDVIYDAFMELYGSNTDDKNVVFQNVKWEFTGNRRSDLKWTGRK